MAVAEFLCRRQATRPSGAGAMMARTFFEGSLVRTVHATLVRTVHARDALAGAHPYRKG